jgi:hypothetical protein
MIYKSLCIACASTALVLGGCGATDPASSAPAEVTASIDQATSSPVVFTWLLSDLGQGGWIGGPLYANGTVGGGGAYAEDGCVARFQGTVWSQAGGMIDICIDATILRGTCPFPSSFCLSQLGVTLPITGTPEKVTLFGDDHIIRVTPTH